MPDSAAPSRQSDALALPATPSAAWDLGRRLDLLRGEAEGFLETPLRALSEYQRGFLETVGNDPSGLLWVSGWLHRDQPLEFPALLLDRQKIPAAVALTCYPRADLPEEAQAVIGVILADWRPSGPDAEVFLFFGEEMRLYQRGAKPLRIMDSRDAIEHFERVRAICTGRLTPALQRLLASPQNWLPDTSRGVAGFPSYAAVDRLLLLDGFGCLAEGWAMSPVKRVERFALKCGGRVLHSDPLASYSRPRRDLREAYPDCAGGTIAERAGFVTVFHGRLEAADFVDPVLKVVFTDGTSTNHPVPPQAMRRIGHSAAPEEALALFPSLRHETFFPDFAAAMGRDAAGRVGQCEPWRVAQVRRAVVLALPQDRSDLYLLFEEARDLATRLGQEMGFVFLAERGSSRSDVLALLQGMGESAPAIPCSLFFVDDVDYAFHLAAEALQAVGAERFLFLSAGVFLSPEGWREGLEALGRDGENDAGAPHLLAIAGAEAGSASADAMVWSTRALLNILPALPVFLGGRHGDNGLHAVGATPTICHCAGGHRSDGGRGASGLTVWINDTIAAAAATVRSRHGEAPHA